MSRRALTTTERGYGADHQKLRQRWAPIVASGRVNCHRCGHPISPGTPWDLGHHDTDRTRYRGPEHRRCNRGAAARKGNRSRRRIRTDRTGLRW